MIQKPEWLTNYEAFNAALRAKQEAESAGHNWEPRERVALLRRVRALLGQCPTKEAGLTALDEMIDGMGYGVDE